MERRSFIEKSIVGLGTVGLLPLVSCEPKRQKEDLIATNTVPELKLSLAQWSLNRALFDGTLKAIDFPRKTTEFGINAVEYVNQFYIDHATDVSYLKSLKLITDNLNISNLLIMVDDEGHLGDVNDKNRKQAVSNHYKWIDAARILGCHSIRVNAFGSQIADELKSALIDGLGQLSDYGAQAGINVLIENHGYHSSNPDFVVDVIKQVDSPYLGTLPDFGNWCQDIEWGSTMENKCPQDYDIYDGLSKFLPYAKGVSAKSYNFDDDGYQKDIDYKKMLQIVKSSDFAGYIGIEYEGDVLSEEQGIIATKNLITEVWQELS